MNFISPWGKFEVTLLDIVGIIDKVKSTDGDEDSGTKPGHSAVAFNNQMRWTESGEHRATVGTTDEHNIRLPNLVGCEMDLGKATEISRVPCEVLIRPIGLDPRLE